MPLPIEALTPREVVAELDRYVVGQSAAKRAVAVALRNRYRRQQLPEAQRDEIAPKNILMIGPTGVGKTEIARRLAQIAKAPFVKVEATKFTEVGYVGRDVDSIIRDLVAQSVRMVEAERTEFARGAIEAHVEEQLVDLLCDDVWFRDPVPLYSSAGEDEVGLADDDARDARRTQFLDELREGKHEDREVGIEVEESGNPFVQVFTPGGIEEMGLDGDAISGAFGSRRHTRRVSVTEARSILFEQLAKREVDPTSVRREAIRRAEQTGMVFLDEIDKVAGSNSQTGPDVSREGVQRDLLPIIEGSTVQTKFGPVRTDYILFIAAGAFHNAKPSDLIPELQGRLPIRVKLESLAQDDFRRILSEPESALIKQYQKLLGADGVRLIITDRALDEVARFAVWVNQTVEDIGARRLHTVVERLLGDLLFEAPEGVSGDVELDFPEVKRRLEDWAAEAEKGKTLL
ncbi:MAG TPA: ATP-dependent protease ATPase subunit HslU [Fimbriimonadaceae bacterium]|nr:ATP-dependent protease ATPase subunit HslU [Fimbriimonadaceae bacterium]